MRSIQQIFEHAGVKVNGSRPWDIQVHDKRFWRRVLLQGNIGLGDSYLDHWWDCGAVDEMVCRLLRVASVRDREPWWIALYGNTRDRLVNLQSLRRAFQVGRYHYDAGNDLYRAMLGESMVYSCARWPEGVSDLAMAQQLKLEGLCRKLGLAPGLRVLDIGCGWGSFCAYAARHYGVEAVGLTVSRKQYDYAREHYAGGAVAFRLQDYRACSEEFDRVVSVGMFEHVGRKNHGTFMKQVRRCLKPEGLFLLHTIGSNQSFRSGHSWAAKHIFPNGYLPSIAQIGRAVENRFVVEDLENIGVDYDRTLMAWHANFEQAWPALAGKQPRYDQRFYRMWRYYLLSCAGAFRARDKQVWQWVLSPGGLPQGYRRP